MTLPGWPPLSSDWPTLAATAEALSDRAATPDARRIFGTLAAMWRAVVRHEPFPPLQAYRGEIREALARALAAADSAAAPAIAALAHYHRPYLAAPGACAWIVMVHEINLSARAARAARLPAAAGAPDPSNPGADHVDRSAERAPNATAGRGSPQPNPPRPVSRQPGLL